MKVCIDDTLVLECSYLMNGGERWNGWVTPIFTKSQLDVALDECANLLIAIRRETGRWDDDEYTDLENPPVDQIGDDEYILGSGWVWQIAEDEKCDECGVGIYLEKCDC